MRATLTTLNGCPMLIIDVTAAELQCAICAEWGFHEHAVSWYEEACCTLHPERGWKTVCKPCHDRWAAWDDLMLQLAAARGVEAILYARYP